VAGIRREAGVIKEASMKWGQLQKSGKGEDFIRNYAENYSGETKKKLNTLLEKYPSLKGFYWAKEKIREFYRQQTRGGDG
jgi:hypothetical protein